MSGIVHSAPPGREHVTDLLERVRAQAHHYRHAQLGFITPGELTEIGDEIQRLRGLIRSVVGEMESDDGEVIHVCAEPDRADAAECVRRNDGFEFELRPAFGPGLWGDLCSVAYGGA